jgi:hypothetical protein
MDEFEGGGPYGSQIQVVTDQSMNARTPETKSLLPSPAYRRAGFAKGRNFPSLVKRDQGRFWGRICLLNYELLSVRR